MGWGSEEAGLGELLNYWGASVSYIVKLRQEGFNVYEGVVGPVSSVWDRAIELYYCIRGGTVDYGLAHSTKFSHARFGRTYPGFGFEWSETKKINLFGHSFGGNTIHFLTTLLNQGSEKEREAYSAANEEVPFIFRGGNDIVFSVTCLSTPHSGTQLANLGIFTDIVKRILSLIISVVGLDTDGDTIFDFKLDQFGLVRELGEGNAGYLERVVASHVWQAGYEDIAPYDLSSVGTEIHNRLYPAENHVYYFNLVSSCTYSVPFLGISFPGHTMWSFLWPTATLLGSTPLPGCDPTDSYENDGVVSLFSQRGSQFGSIVRLTAVSQPVPGAIYFTRIDNNLDHMQVLGFGAYDVYPGYLNYVKFIAELEAAGFVRTRMKDTLGTGFGATSMLARVLYQPSVMRAHWVAKPYNFWTGLVWCIIRLICTGVTR